MNKMVKKSLVGALIAAIVIPPLILGGLPMEALITAVILLSAYELSSLKDQKPNWLIAILIAGAVSVVANVSDSFVIVTAGLLLTVLIVLALISEKYDIDYVSTVFMVGTILVLAIRSIHLIYQMPDKGFVLLFVGLACYICDTGAYFFGSFMGKHKMIPRVSPNKTWEGAIGGYASGAIVSLIYAHFACAHVPFELILTSALILPAVAEIGDLAFSLIKRRYGIKDYGSLLPGHGGVLDRVDSLLFCLMVFHALMTFWGF